MKKVFVVSLVLVMVTTTLLAIPASAVYASGTFSQPNCGCSGDFYGDYCGGVTDGASDRGSAWAYVEHQCDRAYAYVSMKCWIAPLTSLNNYTSRTFTDSGANNGSAHRSAEASVAKDYGNSAYALLGVENYYKISVTHEDEEFSSQEWSSDGDIPLSYIPPVVTE